MRPALICLVPMLAAAVLVMVGGERLARRQVESRTPADRERVLDLDAAFREELRRLERIYLAHLNELAAQAADRESRNLDQDAESLYGLVQIHILPKNGKDLTILSGPRTAGLPEIELNPGKRPLDPGKAVRIDASWLESGRKVQPVWLTAPDPRYRVYCCRPDGGRIRLVAFLIDWEMVKNRTAVHLKAWLGTPLTPLREAGERLSIEQPDGKPLLVIGPTQHGPAASIIPIRSLFGDWQIRSWDGLVISHEYEPASLMIAATLAILLVASGVFLMVQQKRALKAAAERVSFVNRVSHEFGAPLTNLSLNLDLALDFLEHRPAEAKHRMTLIGEEIQRLSRLAGNVLTFSRQERDMLELNPVRCFPAEVVQKVLDSFRPSFERRGVRIETDIPAGETVVMDQDAVSQILGNLLSNVEKYAASGGWMGLIGEIGTHEFIIEVRDRGEGIPAADRERIFAPFERVRDQVNEGSSGTGLGLAIGRDLARRMGGDLELLQSETGARFRLRIPISTTFTVLPHPNVA
ncbi:HAMP domain-containing histidine kinase [Luteolibacter pohnpeiensis]|uniref:histidine kinase n=1 Tax=Luteolibacter pohnpeiensis TaxID=454153 RepID=A0A934S4V5_9BACT|nr:HAMP domain-containing sensor histidine kinase [Luteolibacter pohnpeiensis]MBK1880786.1 HAMP domain-containing histidine kinase [Luteolibacter pohnpeiensis]